MILDVIAKSLKILSSVVGGSIGEKADGVVAALEGEIGNRPEVQAAMLQQELEVKKLILADAEGSRQLIASESKSEDPFVRRARPAFLWLFYIVIVVNFVIIPVLRFSGFEATIVYPDLPEQLYWLFGSSFLGYSGFRTFDKMRKSKTT